MSNSKLVNVVVPASPSNYTVGRSGRKIEAITIHHMAGRLTAEQCGYIWQNPNRQASSNYGIGYDGKIGLYVDECNTSWCNSNWDSNCKSVTIETSDNDNSWYINDITMNSLIKLVADIAKRNNLGKLVKGQNVTWHSMFANTECPGEYLLSKIQYICDEANKINNETPSEDCTGVITYQAYTTYWLPEVHKFDNTDDGYAGIGKEPITGFRCKPQYGELIYEAHINGKKREDWLPKVNSKDYSTGGDNSYAGIYGEPIDCIRIKTTRGWAKYRVQTIEDNWLPWVDSRTETGTESYAGIYGHTIIGIQMY